jgi:hypothetical protein
MIDNVSFDMKLEEMQSRYLEHSWLVWCNILDHAVTSEVAQVHRIALHGVCLTNTAMQQSHEPMQ